MADYNYVTSTGVIVPDTSTILSDVQGVFKVAFGANLVVTPDTPQGVLITAETLTNTGVVRNNAAVSNRLNPNLSAGIFLDAIMALTGIERTVATRTLVPDVSLTGVPSTVIPAGSLAKNTNNSLFYSLNNTVIGLDGTTTVDFVSQEYGAIACPASSLTQIMTDILGWETITNPNAGVVGSSTQSDVSAKAYRNNTLAFQGVGTAPAIISALYATEGVQSLHFQENVAATSETINGILMTPKSVYACVNGGSDLDVAAALLENKSSGSDWVGDVEYTVIEPASGQPYEVRFARPDEVAILVRVTTTNGDEASIKSALLAYAAGEIDGEIGFRVGTDVSPFELAGAISIQYPGIFINKVEVSYASVVSYTTDVLEIDVNEIATLQASGITVVIV